MEYNIKVQVSPPLTISTPLIYKQMYSNKFPLSNTSFLILRKTIFQLAILSFQI